MANLLLYKTSLSSPTHLLLLLLLVVSHHGWVVTGFSNPAVVLLSLHYHPPPPPPPPHEASGLWRRKSDATTRLAIASPTTTTTTTTATRTTTSTTRLGPRLDIREDFPGLQRIYSNPDVYIIEDFLDSNSCQDLINRAKAKGLEQSPVAYAGWTRDFKDLVELAAKGPITWLAIGIGWLQTKNVAGANQVDLIFHMVQNFVFLLLLAMGGIALFTKSRADSLQDLRTSTSTTLDDMTATTTTSTSDQEKDHGPLTFVRRTAQLFATESSSNGSSGSDSASTVQQQEALHFEAPTVIRYEAGQVLAPHYDANQSAATEDANRGGQTLATLLVYLNDVGQGGFTRFGKLSTSHSVPHKQVAKGEEKLSIRPKRGNALLFFPADAKGQFDDRTEHEGCPAVDEKYIARIWRHENRVPPPFGLTDDNIRKV